MNKVIDPEKRKYGRANIRLADAYHRMSEIYEKWATKKGFENTRLSGLNLALGWERLSLENRNRHSDIPENIEAGEKNISRIEEKIKKYEGNKFRDNKFRNT